MGTVIDIVVGSDTPHQHIKEVRHPLTVYKNRFNVSDSDSELMVISHNADIAPVAVHPDLSELIELGKTHSPLQPSNLDIAISPLVQSWRISSKDAKVLGRENIQKAVTLTNPEHITLNAAEKSISPNHKSMKIDPGTLTKGYITDKVVDHLKTKNIGFTMVNLGDSVLVYGDNSKRESGIWRVGTQHLQKQRGNNLGTLTPKDKSVVTSGIYERHLQVDDKDYHHIFDRRTDYPVETGMASLTIVSDLSVNCKIWTTRLFDLSIKQTFETVQSAPNIEGTIIIKDNCSAITNGLE